MKNIIILVLALTTVSFVMAFYFKCRETEQFDGEGNRIPQEAITALVRSQYVLTTPVEDSLINKYFK